MTRWEYFTAPLVGEYSHLRITAALNGLGDEGWELVTVVSAIAYLKRPKSIPLDPSKGDPDAPDPRLMGRPL